MVVCQKVGGAKLSDGSVQEADGQLAGTPSLVFDAVVITTGKEGFEKLIDDPAALEEAVRRVGSIAIVHETLSQNAEETVAFDEIADRILHRVGDVGAVVIKGRHRADDPNHGRHGMGIAPKTIKKTSQLLMHQSMFGNFFYKSFSLF